MRKMRKMKKICLAISMAMSFGVADVALADAAGDSLVYLPANDSGFASPIQDANGNTQTADVWFVKDNTALAYAITLVNLKANTCANGIPAAIADDTKVVTKTIVMADTLSCDDESQLTLPGGDTVSSGGQPVKMCNWRSPILASGNYALGINPIHLGDAFTSTPQRLDAIQSCQDDDGSTHNDNNPANFTWNNDMGFQLFNVADNPIAISQPPNAPILMGPVGEWDVNSNFTFADNSPVEGRATWYKLYIEAPDGSRVHVNGDSWFKLNVDPQLMCSEILAATGPVRMCQITLDEAAVTGQVAADEDLEYTYWIRAYNGDSGGATGPWSPAGKFMHEVDGD